MLLLFYGRNCTVLVHSWHCHQACFQQQQGAVFDKAMINPVYTISPNSKQQTDKDSEKHQSDCSPTHRCVTGSESCVKPIVSGTCFEEVVILSQCFFLELHQLVLRLKRISIHSKWHLTWCRQGQWCVCFSGNAIKHHPFSYT